MESSLSDDMVKLVRYSIVSIKRDDEKEIVSGEERLVTDNLTDDAFTSWMISQNDEAIRKSGVLGNDRQYLRVSYEVRERWPKQDRKYEKRQLEVLGKIRNRIPGQPQPLPPFDEIAKRFNANTVRLRYLRQGFQLGAKTLAPDVSGAFAQFRDLGEFKAIDIVEADLKKAFAQGPSTPFDPAGLDSFPGRWLGVNREFDVTSQERPESAATWHMTWEPGVFEQNKEYLQRVVGSKLKHYGSSELPPLTERKVDLALNVWRPELGIAGWLSTWVEGRSELALISYELSKGAFLWIGQILSEDLEPVGGEKFFWMFFEWIDLGGGKPNARKSYYMYGLQFEIDFVSGRAKLFGDSFRKARIEAVA